MKRDPAILVVVVVVVALMIFFGVRMAHRASGRPGEAVAKVGFPAPDFTLQTLGGQTVKLSDYRGKAVLLNFWATWCEPCKIEMPWFIDLQKQYGPSGLQIVGVAMADADANDSAQFAQAMHVDYPILVGKDADREKIADTYGGVQFLPESFYLNRDGQILDRAFGLKNRSEIEENIRKALGQVQTHAGQ